MDMTYVHILATVKDIPKGPQFFDGHLKTCALVYEFDEILEWDHESEAFRLDLYSMTMEKRQPL
jgi:hypothetical protein